MKKGLFLIGAIFIISMFIVACNPEGGNTAGQAMRVVEVKEKEVLRNRCTDSDGGNNPLVFGWVNKTNATGRYSFIDSCSGNAGVWENYCSGTNNMFAFHNCQAEFGGNYICQSGRCVMSQNQTNTTTTTTSITTIAPTTTTTMPTNGTGNETNSTTTCLCNYHSNSVPYTFQYGETVLLGDFTTCSELNQIYANNRRFCFSSESDDTAYFNCVDTDGGLNINFSGNTTFSRTYWNHVVQTETWRDICQGVGVSENWCVNDIIHSQVFACNNCMNGACVQSNQTNTTVYTNASIRFDMNADNSISTNDILVYPGLVTLERNIINDTYPAYVTKDMYDAESSMIVSFNRVWSIFNLSNNTGYQLNRGYSAPYGYQINETILVTNLSGSGLYYSNGIAHRFNIYQANGVQFKIKIDLNGNGVIGYYDGISSGYAHTESNYLYKNDVFMITFGNPVLFGGQLMKYSGYDPVQNNVEFVDMYTGDTETVSLSGTQGTIYKSGRAFIFQLT